MAKKIIYPGTFDPITKGHSDLVRRARNFFPQVIVAIAEDTVKDNVFSIAQRLAFAKESLEIYTNVEVISFKGLLIDCAKQHQAHMILRGLRAVSDFEYEFQLASMNRRLCKEIETIFLTPDENYAFISSSLVCEIAKLGGSVSEFVDAHVESAMREKFSRSG